MCKITQRCNFVYLRFKWVSVDTSYFSICHRFQHDLCATFTSETMPAAIPLYWLKQHVLYPVVQVSEVEEKLTLPTTREWWWWGDYCCWNHRRWECAAAQGPVRSCPHLLTTAWRLNCWHAALSSPGLPSALCPLHLENQTAEELSVCPSWLHCTSEHDVTLDMFILRWIITSNSWKFTSFVNVLFHALMQLSENK